MALNNIYICVFLHSVSTFYFVVQSINGILLIFAYSIHFYILFLQAGSTIDQCILLIFACFYILFLQAGNTMDQCILLIFGCFYILFLQTATMDQLRIQSISTFCCYKQVVQWINCVFNPFLFYFYKR